MSGASVVACPTCGAKPGELCHTKNGIVDGNTHMARIELWSQSPTGDSIYNDAMPSLKPGQETLISVGPGRVFEVRAHVNKTALHTGRMLYAVTCHACKRVVHEATTGPQQQAEAHVRDGCETLPPVGTRAGLRAMPAGASVGLEDILARSTRQRDELMKEVATLSNELQKLTTRLDEAFILGWRKGVTECIDKLYAYQLSAGDFDGAKAIELLSFHAQHPPSRNDQQVAADQQTKMVDRRDAMSRVARVLNDRKGYHVSDLDEETRVDLLGALVDAVRGS